MDWFVDPQIWISLLTLTGLEIVLGIDNVIFISIRAPVRWKKWPRFKPRPMQGGNDPDELSAFYSARN